jgi:hypothetical protein
MDLTALIGPLMGICVSLAIGWLGLRDSAWRRLGRLVGGLTVGTGSAATAVTAVAFHLV